MDQKKTGQFLKTLRKEKQITQEALAEILHVSNRTVSRWETGSNMPDISLLVELAEFYQVSITEIIDGERKSEKMNQETKMTAMKMAEYSKQELAVEKRKIISVLLMIFSVFVMISALAVFPNESSWGSIYATIGGAGLTVGGYLWMRSALVKMGWRILGVAGCIVALFGFLLFQIILRSHSFIRSPDSVMRNPTARMWWSTGRSSIRLFSGIRERPMRGWRLRDSLTFN